MKYSNKLIEKAKTAKSAEELLAMAKTENIELSADDAAKAFAELHKTGKLSDEELDNVAGGLCVTVTCPHCNSTNVSRATTSKAVQDSGMQNYVCNDCKKHFTY